MKDSGENLPSLKDYEKLKQYANEHNKKDFNSYRNAVLTCLSAYAPIRVKPYKYLRSKEVMLAKKLNTSVQITIHSKHKTGNQAIIDLPNDLYKILLNFYNELCRKFEEIPEFLFCTTKGEQIKNVSTIILSTTEKIIGKRIGGSLFRHSIHTRGEEIGTKKIAAALYHSEETAKQSYLHTSSVNTAFAGKYLP